MTVGLRVIIFSSALLFLGHVLKTLKHKKIDIKLSLLWFLTSILLMIASIFVKEVIVLSGILGFEEAVNMVFFFGLLVLLFISFCLCIVVSKQQKTIIILIQEISLLKKNREYE